MEKTFMRWSFAERRPLLPDPPPGSRIALLAEADLPAVAHLMVEGYRGTIDFEGETDADALAELRGALGGSNGSVMPAGWLLARAPDGTSASALATVRWLGMPFISYVFTAPDRTGQGYAGALIQHAAVSLEAAGETELVLFVTIGNPARSLYERLGFVPAVAPPEVG